MEPAFLIFGVLTVASAVAAMTLRNLVHCALSLIATFCGLACLYLQLHAEFVGLAQVLVYVGAVAILIVFAILLTRSAARGSDPVMSLSWASGLAIAVLVFASLAWSILKSSALGRAGAPAAEVSAKQIGDQLMTRYVLPLEVIALLLTAAMIGAVIIAMHEKGVKK
jgi:NADH-quinone oxidoreductase subunit J